MNISDQIYSSIIYIILFVSLGTMWVSCNPPDPLGQTPAKGNIMAAMEKFYKDSLKYNESQLEFMEGLTALLKSEESYEARLGSKVTTESYQKVITGLTNFLREHNYDYYYFLNCATIAEELDKQEKKELKPIIEQPIENQILFKNSIDSIQNKYTIILKRQCGGAYEIQLSFLPQIKS